jgi:hypothetical protein
MRSSKVFSLILVAVFSGLTGWSVSSVSGDAISIDTSQSGPQQDAWVVSRAGAASSTAVQVTSAFPLEAWINANSINTPQNTKDASAGLDTNIGNHNAQWVSTDSSGGGSNDFDGTKYVFSDTFTMTGNPSPVLLDLYGTFATDNWVTGMNLTFTIDGVTHVLAVSENDLAGDEYSYSSAFDLSAYTDHTFLTPQTFTLNVDVTNSHGTPVPNQNAGPVGLILAGTAATLPPGNIPVTPYGVPLPASSGLGFSMLAGLGVLSVLRKRLGSKLRIA